MTNSNIRIDFTNKTIAITKKFQKQASVYNSAAFNELKEAMNQFPTFELVVRELSSKAKKVDNHKGLTFDAMREYLNSISDNDGLMILEEKIGRINAGFNSESYGTIRKWFLETYSTNVKDNSKNVELKAIDAA